MSKGEKFTGSVILKDWTHGVDGQNYIHFAGRVTILEDNELLGFKTSRAESNWIARVEGPTSTYNFPGCQVRGIVQFEGDIPKKFGINVCVVP